MEVKNYPESVAFEVVDDPPQTFADRIVSGSGAATNVSHVRLYLSEWGRFDDADDMDDAELEEDEDCATRCSPVRKPSRAPVRALLGPPGLLPSRSS